MDRGRLTRMAILPTLLAGPPSDLRAIRYAKSRAASENALISHYRGLGPVVKCVQLSLGIGDRVLGIDQVVSDGSHSTEQPEIMPHTPSNARTHGGMPWVI
jgi:hypothetical protein